MAWIESHTVLARHRKTLELAFDLKIKPVQAVGHLHVFWHTVLEQQEDGDLSKWSDQLIAQAAMWDGDPTEFVSCLRLRGWLDNHLVHDWIDYVGPYLTKKYSTGNPARLKEIWAKHGYKYGKGNGKFAKQKVSGKRAVSEPKSAIPNPSSPNPSSPNLTVIKSLTRSERLGLLESYSPSEATRLWAREGFGVEIPDEVVREFKDYWREKKSLRSDWEATFRNRVRQLVSLKVLVPTVQAPVKNVLCEFRVMRPGDRFLRPCGQLASKDSRQNMPRCTEHLSPVQDVSC